MTKVFIKRSADSRNKEFLALKSDKVKLINNSIGKLREAIISPILGQEYVYRKKLEEATSYKEGKTATYLFLEKEANERGVTLAVLSDMIVGADLQSSIELSNIEALRTEFKLKVDAAESYLELDQILSEFEERVLIYES